MAEEITTRQAEVKDIEAVSRFRTAFFEYGPGTMSREPEYYRWKYFENPYPGGELWIAERDGQIIGMTGMTPKPMVIGGREVSGAEIGDTFTHPDHQRQGIFNRLFTLADRSAREKDTGFIYGLPNAQALPGYVNKHDYSPARFTLINMLKILNASEFTSVPLAGQIGNALAILIWGRGAEAKESTDIRVETVKEPPPDVDDLWQKAYGDYSLAIKRDRQYLAWRYTDSPAPYLILTARDSSGELRGYLTAARAQQGKYTVYRAADFLTVQDEGNAFAALISMLTSKAKEDGAAAVSATSIKDNYYYRLLRKAGFIPRNRIPVICNAPEETGVVNSGKIRHLTLGDSDNI